MISFFISVRSQTGCEKSRIRVTQPSNPGVMSSSERNSSYHLGTEMW